MKIIRMLGFAVLGALLSRSGRGLVAGRAPAGRLGERLARVDRRRANAHRRLCRQGRAAGQHGVARGFTGQYKGLEELWRRYKDKGLVVLGVPSNDFGSQEPGSNEEIKRFCEASFDVTFPLADKQVVSGAQRPSALSLGRGADRRHRHAQLELPQDPDRPRRADHRLVHTRERHRPQTRTRHRGGAGGAA